MLALARLPDINNYAHTAAVASACARVLRGQPPLGPAAPTTTTTTTTAGPLARARVVLAYTIQPRACGSTIYMFELCWHFLLPACLPACFLDGERGGSIECERACVFSWYTKNAFVENVFAFDFPHLHPLECYYVTNNTRGKLRLNAYARM